MIKVFHKEIITEITALAVIKDVVVAGIGQHLHVLNILSGKLVYKGQVFSKNSVHGVQSVTVKNCKGVEEVLLLVWGQRSVAVLLLHQEFYHWRFVAYEDFAEDWIVAGCWLVKQPKPADDKYMYFVLQTAHNALLKYALSVDGKFDSILTKLETKLLKAVRPSLYQLLEHKAVLNRVCDQVVSSEHEGKVLLIDKVQCSEKCILFCGCLTPIGFLDECGCPELQELGGHSCWCYLLVMGGTSFGEVVIWSPGKYTSTNAMSQFRVRVVEPWQVLRVHKGVIFSIHWNSQLEMFSTTSDDRDVKLFQFVKIDSSDKTAEVRNKLDHCSVVPVSTYVGHTARVWKSLIINEGLEALSAESEISRGQFVNEIPVFVVSVGEDSNVCVWNRRGTLVKIWNAHEGASIWTLANFLVQTNDRMNSTQIIFTGAADGSIKRWSLTNEHLYQSNAMQIEKSLCCERTFKTMTSHKANVCPVARENKDISVHSTKDQRTQGALFKQVHYHANQHRLMVNNFDGTFVRSVALLSSRDCLLVLDNGDLWLWTPTQDDDLHLQFVLRAKDYVSDYSIIASKIPGTETGSAATNCRHLVSVCGLEGDILVFQYDNTTSERLKFWFKDKHVRGKIFSAGWLTDEHILTCHEDGRIILAHIHNVKEIIDPCSASTSVHGPKLLRMSELSLPPSRQRWFTAACLILTSSLCPSESRVQDFALLWKKYCLAVVVGDRSGSLFLYCGESPTPLWAAKGIHGKHGVVSVTPTLLSGRSECGLEMFVSRTMLTTGRDCCIRHWRCDQDSSSRRPFLTLLTCTRHAAGSWVVRGITFTDHHLIVSFRGAFLQLWSDSCAAVVASIPCGGGHRSWDFRLNLSLPNNALSNASDAKFGELVTVFTKDGSGYFAQTPLFFLPPMKVGLARKTILSGCLLLCHSTLGSALAFAGEDNIIRIQHLKYNSVKNLRPDNEATVVNDCESHVTCQLKEPGGYAALSLLRRQPSCGPATAPLPHPQQCEWRQLAALSSHISAVKSLSVMRHVNRRKSAPEKNCGDEDDLWVVSGGGRAQMKIWKLRKEVLELELQRSSADNFLEAQSCVQCVEVVNHQLLEDRPSSWKAEQNMTEAENRHMAVSGLWLSETFGLVATASSDAKIRLFQIFKRPPSERSDSDTSFAVLKDLCEVSCSNCLLSLEIFTVSPLKGSLKVAVMLRASDTRGHLFYWLLKPKEPTLKLIVKNKLHNGSINSVASISVPLNRFRKEIDSQIAAVFHTSEPTVNLEMNNDEPFLENTSMYEHTETYFDDVVERHYLLTGGDDAVIYLNEVLFYMDTNDDNATNEITKDSITGLVLDCTAAVLFSPIRHLQGHSSQITGLCWISLSHFLSISVDQRLTVWKISYSPARKRKKMCSDLDAVVLPGDCKSPTDDDLNVRAARMLPNHVIQALMKISCLEYTFNIHIEVAKSLHTGVADPHGLLVWPNGCFCDFADAFRAKSSVSSDAVECDSSLSATHCVGDEEFLVSKVMCPKCMSGKYEVLTYGVGCELWELQLSN